MIDLLAISAGLAVAVLVVVLVALRRDRRLRKPKANPRVQRKTFIVEVEAWVCCDHCEVASACAQKRHCAHGYYDFATKPTVEA